MFSPTYGGTTTAPADEMCRCFNPYSRLLVLPMVSTNFKAHISNDGWLKLQLIASKTAKSEVGDETSRDCLLEISFK